MSVSYQVNARHVRYDIAKGLTIPGRYPNQFDIYLQAEALLNQIIELDSAHVEARYDLARIYYAKNELDKAAAMLAKVLVLQPDMNKAKQLLNRINTKRGKP